MIIFFQELVLLLFLWMLRLIDGIMEIFSAISGITDVTYQGQKVNIIEYLVGSTGVSTIFWCVFILAVGLGCIFAIAAIIKNMISNNRNLSGIMGKFFLSLLGTMAMLVVVILGILISNAVLQLVAEIFQIENTVKISNMLFDACVGEWLNGYSVKELDVSSLSVGQIFGDYNATAFGIWPTSWKLNGMVNPNSFLYLPSMIASIGLMIALLIAIINLAKRVYEIIFLYIVMPISASTLCLDDGARFKVWREMFITKIVIAYGTVFSVNIFILLLPMISKMQIESIGNFGNSLFLIIMIIGGAMVIPAGQTLFARLFGQADDMHAGGGFLHTVFYGGRIVSGLTLGTVSKLVRGTFKVGGKIKDVAHRQKAESTDRYTDNGGTDNGGTDNGGTDNNHYNETDNGATTN